MGNCSNLCSRIIIPNADVPVNSNSSSQKHYSSKIISKFNKPALLKKIILIQSKTRTFLYRLKKLNKSSKYTTKTKLKSGVNSSSNNYTKIKSLKKDDNSFQKKNPIKTQQKVNLKTIKQ